MNIAIINAIVSGDSAVDLLEATQKVHIKDPIETIEKLAQKYEYSKNETDLLKTNFSIEPQNSLYGIVNAFTRTARDTTNIERRIEIENFAGNLIRDHKLAA